MKKKKIKEFDYENQEYLKKLDDLPSSYYSKYVEFIKKYIINTSKFLDVGCGNGEVLIQLKKQGFDKGYGLDISSLFIEKAKRRGLKNVYSYDGKTIPFKNNTFDLAGSFNVLEHTPDPNKFISDQVKIIKSGGLIIIACPNFLSSVLISPHPRVNGLKRKILNPTLIVKKLIDRNSTFSSMPIIKRKHFQYDDDAIVITNLIDIKRTLKSLNCEVVYESGFINYNHFLIRVINSISFLRYMLPSCFVVAKKR